MKLKVGSKYEARARARVIILYKLKGKNKFPYVGVSRFEGLENMTTFSSGGMYGITLSSFDIVKEVKPRVKAKKAR